MLPFSMRTGALATALALSGMAPVVAGAEEADPLERMNRSIFSFNETVDKYTLKPLAQGYRYITPDIAETAVSNFFHNLRDVNNLANNLFQLKFEGAGKSLARLAFNSTFGLAGFIDVATPMGIERRGEDFGQTLGYWGVPSGPYLVLPFFGPSTVRDGSALIVDVNIDLTNRIDHVPTRNSLYGLLLIDTRSRLLEAEQIVTGDKYLFVRDAYLQRRDYLINDGQVSVQYDEDF
ncbi:VacJ family lipoprotein [Marinobacterium stanieri]|uniref:Phospholipid-binding lipoprotein MlaA n=1 Tax=Marinobacterium stanieri TaxID=49186 RepID=A0A1N6Q4X6_9GAMM|nr:VacJ family lipoprotein [Marinobacterium stanieri]SIQ11641.1 phospholipid-binding lipoprotein MlaA [Marinobacterium stanieri]